MLFSRFLAISTCLGGLANAVDIQLVPGPGLPTLESQNITAEDLSSWTLGNMSAPKLKTRDCDNERFFQGDTCGTSGQMKSVENEVLWGAGLRSAWACYVYLNALRQNVCKLEGHAFFCMAKYDQGDYDAVVKGWTSKNATKSPETSYCGDVGQGLKWILQNCQGEEGEGNTTKTSIGRASSNGNGELYVELRRWSSIYEVS
ncbi:hypothetical protein B0T16DRAFT_395325 [Cercophora newfieldiana]|uniref:Ecp2 effector protein domain-containing protein n=1 Tax=Cercophora newfieldiana TaxID=92897 RepID=A0AA39XV28_9PEZI|nr:hypothetical protein B0T16DRAFT_395325 [Cercophora newfieldiana]